MTSSLNNQNSTLRNLILIWLLWALIVLAFQGIASARFQPNRPDYALEWTKNETARTSNRDKDFLNEPFMNHQVAWDSEFYVGIAVGGYDDPRITTGELHDGTKLPLSYAFFPLYPATMAVVAAPLGLLGLNPIAAASLAGVLVGLLGTLVGLISLYDLTRDELGNEGGLRAVFYMLIFPSAFFFAQVYTEGLFVGLAFGCLALIRRKQFWAAAFFAGLATLTKALGLALVFPLVIGWVSTVDWKVVRGQSSGSQKSWLEALNIKALLSLVLPLTAYLAWNYFLGEKAFRIEHEYFGRGLFNWAGFGRGLEVMFNSFRDGSISEMTTYYAIEAFGAVLAVVACLFTARRYPGLALFSILVLVLSITSSAPQSIIRYVLAIPAIYILLARLGRNAIFDRSWTVFSLLMMGMLASLYTFNMWVA